MKKRLARLLLRLARWLQPVVIPEPCQSLDFVTSVELVAELRKRNDTFVVFYGRRDGEDLNGHLSWQFSSREEMQIVFDALEARANTES